MRCKTFTVPLGPEAALDCERNMDGFMEANNVKRIFASLANQPEGAVWSVLFFYEGEAPATRQTAASPSVAAGPDHPPSNNAIDPGNPLTGEQVRSIVALKKWRADAAAAEGVPLYMVAQNKWLEEMVRMPARTLDDLKKIAGFGACHG